MVAIGCLIPFVVAGIGGFIGYSIGGPTDAIWGGGIGFLVGGGAFGLLWNAFMRAKDENE
jgi:hypothetical protein